MKKVKIMLLSLALFAIVGGALAFKAKYGPSRYCTTFTIETPDGFTCPAADPGLACPLLQNATTTLPNQPGVILCTTTEPAGGCNDAHDCIIFQKIKVNS